MVNSFAQCGRLVWLGLFLWAFGVMECLAAPIHRADETRALTLPEARVFMVSTEAPAWKIFKVESPKKSKQCKEAVRFSKPYGVKTRCSSLYLETRIWIKPRPRVISGRT